MNYKIVSDSSSNIFALHGVDYVTVPMKVIAGQTEYVDTPALDVAAMVEDLRQYKGKSGSSCPNVSEWLTAFGDADCIFALTISKNLSGSYNSAQEACQEYMEAHPGKRAVVLNTLSAGPQQMMLVEKLRELILRGLDMDEILDEAMAYYRNTHIIFCLESMNNLARNGRVNPAVAKIAGVLGIRAAGDAKGGQITPVVKPRGEKKATLALVELMLERGLYDGALVRIAHCLGLKQANDLKAAVLERLPNCRFIIEPTTALCSFYAEAGGLMIGFEGGYNVNNDPAKF